MRIFYDFWADIFRMLQRALIEEADTWAARKASASALLSTFETLLPLALAASSSGMRKGAGKLRLVSWQKHFAMIYSEAQG